MQRATPDLYDTFAVRFERAEVKGSMGDEGGVLNDLALTSETSVCEILGHSYTITG